MFNHNQIISVMLYNQIKWVSKIQILLVSKPHDRQWLKMKCRCIEMKFIPDHAPNTKKQIVELEVPYFTTNIVLKQTLDLSNTKTAQLFMHMLDKVFTLFWARYNLHLSIYPHM